MWVVLFLLLILLLAISYLWHKAPYHPLLVYAGVWLLVIGLWSFDDIFTIIGYIKISDKAWMNIFVVHFAFALGSISAGFMQLYSQKGVKGTISIPISSNSNIPKNSKKIIYLSFFLFLLSAVGYFSYISLVLKSVNLGSGIIGVFRQWNYEEAYGALGGFGGVMGRLYTLPQIAIPFNLFMIPYYPTYRKKLIIISIVEMLFLLSPRRALLFQTAVLIILILLITKKIKITLKTIFIIILLLFLFSYSQFILNKSMGNGMLGALKDIYVYVTGNIPSFSVLMDIKRESDGYMSFSILYNILKAIGYPSTNVDLSIAFVNIPIPFNTVPYNYYFLMDFGIWGSFLVVFLIAYVITILYYKIHKLGFYNESNNFSIVYIYSYLLMGIVFSFRENIWITYNSFFLILISLLIGVVLKNNRN